MKFFLLKDKEEEITLWVHNVSSCHGFVVYQTRFVESAPNGRIHSSEMKARYPVNNRRNEITVLPT
jgi:hypothetical protein